MSAAMAASGGTANGTPRLAKTRCVRSSDPSGRRRSAKTPLRPRSFRCQASTPSPREFRRTTGPSATSTNAVDHSAETPPSGDTVAALSRRRGAAATAGSSSSRHATTACPSGVRSTPEPHTHFPLARRTGSEKCALGAARNSSSPSAPVSTVANVPSGPALTSGTFNPSDVASRRPGSQSPPRRKLDHTPSHAE